jgi:F0F1-type ATP synthase membrane subunit b/b'
MIAFPPDITFVIQIISFFVLWFGLKRLLFDPVLQVVDERKARTVGVREEAAQ